MNDQTMLGWAVVLATFVGPIVAVFITRGIDELRARRARKLDTFRTMLRNRRSQLSADFVSGLNMVEVDFYNAPKVLAIHAELMKHFNTRTADQFTYERSQRLVARLLYVMGQNLGYSMEQLDILEGGYVPQSMVDEQTEQALLRRSLLTVLTGQRPLPVTLQAPTSQNAIHDVPPP
jgi:hypothetical protein